MCDITNNLMSYYSDYNINGYCKYNKSVDSTLSTILAKTLISNVFFDIFHPKLNYTSLVADLLWKKYFIWLKGKGIPIMKVIFQTPCVFQCMLHMVMKPHMTHKGHIGADLAQWLTTLLSKVGQQIVHAGEMTCSC